MKDLSTVLRVVRPSDAPALEALYRQLVSNPDVRVRGEHLEALAADPRTRLFVGEVDGRLVATAHVSLCPDAMFGLQPFAVVENVVVDDAFQGRGLGRALMEAIERFCREADCSKIMLLSSVHRSGAHRFFQACGFEGDGKRAFVKYRSRFGGES